MPCMQMSSKQKSNYHVKSDYQTGNEINASKRDGRKIKTKEKKVIVISRLLTGTLNNLMDYLMHCNKIYTTQNFDIQHIVDKRQIKVQLLFLI